MMQGIKLVQLYDKRLYNFGVIINDYRDVYIDIEKYDGRMDSLYVEQLINNTYVEISDREKRIIINIAKQLDRDQNYNSYVLDFSKEKISKYNVDY